MAERRARTTWRGDLASGSGTTEFDSGAIPAQPVSWSARTEESGGKTSPEELLAGAEATCFSMALSHALGEAGTPATELNVEAVCSFERQEAGFAVTSIRLTVRGSGDGLDEAGFRQAAEEAKANCPVSKALAGNVEISLDAALA
jgi:osmotically inducible protein OsmC